MAIAQDTLTEQIRAKFREVGPKPLREITEECINAGIFDTQRYALMLRVCEPIVQKALSHVGLDGMPFAGPSAEQNGDRKQIWKQRDLWSEDDSTFNIQMRATSTLGDIKVVKRLNDEHERRWGYRIDLPALDW